MTAENGTLNRRKAVCARCRAADYIVVVARDGVFVADTKAPGIEYHDDGAMDLTRKRIRFDSEVAAEKLDGVEGLIARSTSRPRRWSPRWWAACSASRYHRWICENAEAVWEADRMFQAVQHQCADMYLETESARSAVYYAAGRCRKAPPTRPSPCRSRRSMRATRARTVGNRAIQIHGGMGFTWENDLHLYYRRAKASETMLGDATAHRERLARLIIDAGAKTSTGS